MPDASEWAAKRAYERQFQVAAVPASVHLIEILSWRERGDPTLLVGLLVAVLAIHWWLGDGFVLAYCCWTPLLYWLTNVHACETTLLLCAVRRLAKCRPGWHLMERRHFEK